MLEQQFRGAVIMLIKMGSLPPGFRQLWSNQRLLNVVEQFIGPNIAGMPASKFFFVAHFHNSSSQTCPGLG